MGIIRRAAEPQTYVTTRYKDVRAPVRAFLADLARRGNPLNDAEAMFAQRAADPAESDLRQDDARQSIEVIRSLRGMANVLAPFQFVEAPHSQPKLMLSGVEVSVRADLWVYGNRSGSEQIGGALLRMTQDDGARREDMGLSLIHI